MHDTSVNFIIHLMDVLTEILLGVLCPLAYHPIAVKVVGPVISKNVFLQFLFS